MCASISVSISKKNIWAITFFGSPLAHRSLLWPNFKWQSVQINNSWNELIYIHVCWHYFSFWHRKWDDWQWKRGHLLTSVLLVFCLYIPYVMVHILLILLKRYAQHCWITSAIKCFFYNNNNNNNNSCYSHFSGSCLLSGSSWTE